MRWLRHLFAPSAASRFPAAVLQRIAQAIAAGEAMHTGQVCFAVESRLPLRGLWRGTSSRARAATVFSRLRVWDTAANNGVLIYLLLADHAIEAVADRGVPVPGEAWAELCERLAVRLRGGEHEAAVIEAVQTVSGWLARDFPQGAGASGANELPDEPALLD
jgi:uncharacterized membrane protein